jgi:hypothetical protein
MLIFFNLLIVKFKKRFHKQKIILGNNAAEPCVPSIFICLLLSLYKNVIIF